MMEIKELDPKKRCAFIVNGEHVTVDDIRMIAEKLKGHGLNDPIVLADVSIRGGEEYFGLYCRQCGAWWVNPDGTLLFYPAPEIANAHMNDNGWFKRGPVHLWQVQKFGEEERFHPDNLPAGAPVCPVHVVNRSSIYA